MPEAGPSSQARQVSSGPAVSSFTWTRDGQLVVAQDSGLNLLNSDSGLKTPLTTEEGFLAGEPSACSDGRYIVFTGLSLGGKRTGNIWRLGVADEDDVGVGVAADEGELAAVEGPVEVGYFFRLEIGDLLARGTVEGLEPQ